MDGWITIGTDVDSKEFDKEIKRLQKESERLSKEEEKLLNKEAKLELDTSKAKQELDSLDKKIAETYSKLEKAKASPKSSNKEIETLSSQHDSLINKSAILGEKYEYQKGQLNSINQKIIENATNQSMVKDKIEEIESKSSGLKLNFDGIGKSMMDNVKKASKWVMAIFSVRSAYSAIRQAMSVISTYNDNMNNKLYSIKMIFASALEPIVTRLVNLAWKLMGYVAYIAKAWFGVDILAKASANSMKSGAKSAEKMKKSLTGFDEATILNDNGTTGSLGGTASQFVMPENVEIPSWIQWIADNKDLVLGFLKNLGILITALKLAKLLGLTSSLGKGLSTIFGFLKGMSGLQIFGLLVGVAVTIAGIITTIQGIISFIKDPSWESFNKILQGLSITLVGVGIAMVALNASNPVGWILIAVGAIGTLITAFLSQEKSIKSVEQAEKDLKTAQENLKQATEDYVNSLDSYDNALKNVEESQKLLEEAQNKTGLSGEQLFEQVQNGTLKYQDMNAEQKEVYKAYMNNMKAQDDLKISTENLEKGVDNLKEAQENEKLASWESKLAVAAEKGEFDEYKKSVVEAFEKGEISSEQARDLIGKSMSDMSRDAQKTFMKDLPDSIKDGLDPKNYETAGQKFTKWASGIWDSVKSGAGKVWDGVKSFFGFSKGGIVYDNGTVQGFSKGGIVYPKLQYCASGAIINQPGRGVPITQAIGGERGSEGIIPLTDSQQMDLLGASIARHMTINLTNVNQMNGRTISRELKRIEVQQDFATNS